MIKLTDLDDLKKISALDIKPYIERFMTDILHEYDDFCPDCSLESIGAIYFIEQKNDIQNYKEFGLSSPLCESQFEWIEYIDDYINGCIVINNDFAINIIGKKEYFEIL